LGGRIRPYLDWSEVGEKGETDNGRLVRNETTCGVGEQAFPYDLRSRTRKKEAPVKEKGPKKGKGLKTGTPVVPHTVKHGKKVSPLEGDHWLGKSHRDCKKAKRVRN